MGVSKVEYNNETLIDVSNDTVTPSTLAKGVTAHDANGDPIVGTMPPEGGGISAQVQTDYEQNDSTKVDFIKNRPFYTEDEVKHTVVWKDENIDYYNYKIGNIIPRKGVLNELSVHLQWVGANIDATIKISDEFTIESPYGEDAVISGTIGPSGSMLQALFAYSDILNADGSVFIPAGIYCVDSLGSINDSINDPNAIIMEFTYTFHKQVDTKYLPYNPLTIVFDFYDMNEDIPITSTENVFKMYASLYSPVDLRIFFRCSGITGEDGNLAYFPARNLGLGIVEVTFLGETLVYSTNIDTMSLQLLGTRPLLPKEEQTATTYGLRRPSLSDQINASLEERGLTPERFKELFPNVDLTTFI